MSREKQLEAENARLRQRNSELEKKPLHNESLIESGIDEAISRLDKANSLCPSPTLQIKRDVLILVRGFAQSGDFLKEPIKGPEEK